MHLLDCFVDGLTVLIIAHYETISLITAFFFFSIHFIFILMFERNYLPGFALQYFVKCFNKEQLFFFIVLFLWYLCLHFPQL